MINRQLQFLDYAENLRHALKLAKIREYILYTIAGVLALTITYLATHQIITLVPYGINEKVKVAVNYVSPNYLSFLGMADAAAYFNYDPSNVKQQSEKFLERVYPKIFGETQVKLLSRAVEIQKNTISQVFYPEKYYVRKNSLDLIIQGRLIKMMVDKIISTENIVIEISYQLINGYAYIKEWKYHA